MKLIRFIRDFDAHALIARENCILCKVWGIIAYRASPDPIPVPEETADQAIAAGAAIEVKA